MNNTERLNQMSDDHNLDALAHGMAHSNPAAAEALAEKLQAQLAARWRAMMPSAGAGVMMTYNEHTGRLRITQWGGASDESQ